MLCGKPGEARIPGERLGVGDSEWGGSRAGPVLFTPTDGRPVGRTVLFLLLAFSLTL